MPDDNLDEIAGDASPETLTPEAVLDWLDAHDPVEAPNVGAN